MQTKPSIWAIDLQLMAVLRYLRGLLPLILGLGIWQAFGPAKSPYFPRPSEWFDSIVFLERSGKLWSALAATVTTFFIGVALACLIGFTVGILIGRSRVLRRALGPLLEFCRGLPPPVLVPVAVLLLGYAESLKLLVVVWVSIWPILLNTTTATGLVDELLLDVSRTFHFGPITTVRKIVVPAVIPPFLLGVRIAIPLAIIITLLVEMLTSLPGIGSLIVTSQRQFRSAEVYGLLALVGVFGLLVNAVFGAIEQKVLKRWPPMAQ
jgi:ABC-type nitrate/sulfonate/bicarbonate transport system permease component